MPFPGSAQSGPGLAARRQAKAAATGKQSEDRGEEIDREALEAAGWSFEKSSHLAIGKRTRRFFASLGGAPTDGLVVAFIPKDGEDVALWKNQVGEGVCVGACVGVWGGGGRAWARVVKGGGRARQHRQRTVAPPGPSPSPSQHDDDGALEDLEAHEVSVDAGGGDDGRCDRVRARGLTPPHPPTFPSCLA